MFDRFVASFTEVMTGVKEYVRYESDLIASMPVHVQLKDDILTVAKTQLSRQERNVIVHIFYEGHSQEETAKIMGISQPSVCIYLKRALRKSKDKRHSFDI